MDIIVQIIGIIGTIATICAIYLSIVLYKRTMYPGKITLVKQTTISLFNTIAKNFDEITIEYKNEPIKENVIYLKACLINDGDTDIDGKSIEKPIILQLQDGLKWIKTKITGKSQDLICNNIIHNEGKSLEFSFGLFRKEEFLQFEGLIEIQDAKYNRKDIFEYLKIHHRIANTQDIQQSTTLHENEITSKRKELKFYIKLFFIFSPIWIATPFVFSYFAPNTNTVFIDSNKVEYKTYEAYSDSTIILKDIINNKKFTVSQNELQNQYKFKIINPNENHKLDISMTIYLTIPLIFIVFSLLITPQYISLRKANKIHIILNSQNKE